MHKCQNKTKQTSKNKKTKQNETDNRIWANSQSKNNCYFHKSLGIERLPFFLESKIYFRTTDS